MNKVIGKVVTVAILSCLSSCAFNSKNSFYAPPQISGNTGLVYVYWKPKGIESIRLVQYAVYVGDVEVGEIKLNGHGWVELQPGIYLFSLRQKANFLRFNSTDRDDDSEGITVVENSVRYLTLSTSNDIKYLGDHPAPGQNFMRLRRSETEPDGLRDSFLDFTYRMK